MSQEQPAAPAARPRGRFNPGAALAGIIFIAIGVLFLLDSLDATEIRREVVWPAMLIALGLAVILSALWRGRRR
jgi:multisubunit Na+/H+ antiporter MnhB subunit